jgi:hypothetical protein
MDHWSAVIFTGMLIAARQRVITFEWMWPPAAGWTSSSIPSSSRLSIQL